MPHLYLLSLLFYYHFVFGKNMAYDEVYIEVIITLFRYTGEFGTSIVSNATYISTSLSQGDSIDEKISLATSIVVISF